MPFLQSLNELEPHQWQHLEGTETPFTNPAFLLSLERSGCTTAETGWQPHHWVQYDAEGKLLALLPSWLKSHSFGEYVFDWAWAEGWERYGLPYYPKLLSAIPFTPCQGPRLLTRLGADRNAIARTFLSELVPALHEHQASSWHLLFPDQATLSELEHPELFTRLNCQFHWHNPGYRDFNDFLDRLRARHRKQLRRERRQVAEQGIELRRLTGSEVSTADLDAFHVFYQATYLKRGQSPYLNRAFFEQLIQHNPEQVTLVMAYHGERRCAAALFLHDQNTLYGRYWGCMEEYDQLHFEACYYQGIELCIERDLTRFDAGAQGEHKLKRGFEPVLLESRHYIAAAQFRPAVEQFCEQEARMVRAYARDAASILPYRHSD